MATESEKYIIQLIKKEYRMTMREIESAKRGLKVLDDEECTIISRHETEIKHYRKSKQKIREYHYKDIETMEKSTKALKEFVESLGETIEYEEQKWID